MCGFRDETTRRNSAIYSAHNDFSNTFALAQYKYVITGCFVAVPRRPVFWNFCKSVSILSMDLAICQELKRDSVQDSSSKMKNV